MAERAEGEQGLDGAHERAFGVQRGGEVPDRVARRARRVNEDRFEGRERRRGDLETCAGRGDQLCRVGVRGVQGQRVRVGRLDAFEEVADGVPDAPNGKAAQEGEGERDWGTPFAYYDGEVPQFREMRKGLEVRNSELGMDRDGA